VVRSGLALKKEIGLSWLEGNPLRKLHGSINCWLWILIIFLIHRSLISAVFIPHEVFTPQKYVHSSTWGSAEGGYPLCGVLVNVYCNFIVNMDRSLEGCRSNGRDYVRVFLPRRKPSFMREMYFGYG
jgi:hypothetical protein